MINNPVQLKDHILGRLGAPIINVELTETQIYDCIDRALELYGEYHYDGLHRVYHTFYVNSEEEYRHGVFSLRDKGVFAVTQVLRTNTGSITSLDGNAAYPWLTDFVLGLAGTATGGGCNKTFGPNSFGADLSYYSMLMSYRSMMQDFLSPVPDYIYNADTELIQFTGKFAKGDVIIVEAYNKVAITAHNTNRAGYIVASGYEQPEDYSLYDEYSDMKLSMGNYRAGIGHKQESGSFNNRWVKDYATALAKELNGQILAKHQGMTLVGGVTIDGVRLINEAREEIDKLKEELYLLDPPVGILVG